MAGRRVEKAALVEQFSDPTTAERVLQGLADERLVVLRGEEVQATAELAHDTLPLHWEQLRGWVRENQKFCSGGSGSEQTLQIGSASGAMKGTCYAAFL